MDSLTTVTYDQIAIGDSATYTRTVTERDVVLFSEVSGDHNPLHLDEGYASGTAFGERIAHGMLSGAFISACVAMKMLGPGTVYLGQTMKFLRPVTLGQVDETPPGRLGLRLLGELFGIQIHQAQQHARLVATCLTAQHHHIGLTVFFRGRGNAEHL